MGYVGLVAADEQQVVVGAGSAVYVGGVDGGWAKRWQGQRDGYDDVTSVALAQGKVLYGTTGGRLAGLDGREWQTKDAEEVRSVAYWEGSRCFAAVTGSDTLGLFDLEGKTTKAESQVHLLGREPIKSRVWRATWLDGQTLGTTVWASREPIRLYSVRPSGLSPEPTMRIGIQVDKLDSVYPLEPLHGTGCKVFASGCQGGEVRVHDMRCAGGEAQYCVPNMGVYGAVYSLLSRPGHHLLAGSASSNVVSVLDLRAKAFMRIPLTSYETAAETGTVLLHPDMAGEATEPTAIHTSSKSCYDWFAAKGSSQQVSYDLYLPDRGVGSRYHGSVYSLASPSPYSPFILAGLEGSVVQLALDGAAAPTPDPPVRRRLGAGNPGPLPRSWRQPAKPISGEETLAAISHGSATLVKQRSVSETTASGRIPGDLDERWFDPDHLQADRHPSERKALAYRGPRAVAGPPARNR